MYWSKGLILLAAYLIGGYATTDILRLTKGVSIDQLDGDCHCPSCGWEIPVRHQIPIFSFLLLRGRCKRCTNPIPKESLLLELAIPAVLCLIAAACDFAPISLFYGFLAYQSVKVIWIFKKGKQEERFSRRLFLSLFTNLLIFVACYLLSLVVKLVKASL